MVGHANLDEILIFKKIILYFNRPFLIINVVILVLAVSKSQ